MILFSDCQKILSTGKNLSLVKNNRKLKNFLCAEMYCIVQWCAISHYLLSILPDDNDLEIINV